MKVLFIAAIVIWLIGYLIEKINDFKKSDEVRHTRDKPIDFTELYETEDNSDDTPYEPNAPTIIDSSSKWKYAPDEVFKENYISYSRINSFKRCPKLFEIVYLQGHKDVSGRAAEVGQLVHKMLELYVQKQITKRGENIICPNFNSDILNYYKAALKQLDLNYEINKSELKPYFRHF
jgi:hypothetical protein